MTPPKLGAVVGVVWAVLVFGIFYVHVELYLKGKISKERDEAMSRAYGQLAGGGAIVVGLLAYYVANQRKPAREEPEAAPPSTEEALVEHTVSYAAVAVAGYWWWTYGGLFRWAAELQMELLHRYQPFVVFMVVVLILLTPLIVIRRLRYGRWMPVPGSRRAAMRRLPAHVMFISALGTMLGITLWREGRTMTLSVLTIADLEAGRRPASQWLQLDAVPWRRAATWGDTGFGRRYFVPLVSHDTQPTGIIAFAMLRREAFENVGDDPTVFKGTLWRLGLPGHLRTYYGRSKLRLGENPLVLNTDGTPESSANSGKALVIAGGACLLIGAVAEGLRRRFGRQ